MGTINGYVVDDSISETDISEGISEMLLEYVIKCTSHINCNLYIVDETQYNRSTLETYVTTHLVEYLEGLDAATSNVVFTVESFGNAAASTTALEDLWIFI